MRKKLGSTGLLIPQLTLSGTTYIFTGNPNEENFGGSGAANCGVKFDCTEFNYLKIGAKTGLVSITGYTLNNVSSAVSTHTNIEIDISNYVFLQIQASANKSLSSGYRRDATLNYSASLTDMMMYI